MSTTVPYETIRESILDHANIALKLAAYYDNHVLKFKEFCDGLFEDYKIDLGTTAYQQRFQNEHGYLRSLGIELNNDSDLIVPETDKSSKFAQLIAAKRLEEMATTVHSPQQQQQHRRNDTPFYMSAVSPPALASIGNEDDVDEGAPPQSETSSEQSEAKNSKFHFNPDAPSFVPRMLTASVAGEEREHERRSPVIQVASDIEAVHVLKDEERERERRLPVIQEMVVTHRPVGGSDVEALQEIYDLLRLPFPRNQDLFEGFCNAVNGIWNVRIEKYFNMPNDYMNERRRYMNRDYRNGFALFLFERVRIV